MTCRIALLIPIMLAAGPAPQSVLNNIPLHFEPNMGQADPTVLYSARARGLTVFLTRSETVFAGPGQKPVRLRFEGAKDNAALEPVERLPGVSNYYRGNDPRKWRAGVPHYARVRAKRVYPGVDVVYYGNARRIEYDFVVAPGTDPDVIRLAYDGVDKLSLDDNGDLLLKSATAELRQHKPVVWQEVGGRRVEVAGRYRIRNGRVGFELARYDRSKPVVIDPVLSYGTLLGGSEGDGASAVAVDSSGNIVVAGTTQSSNFPIQAGVDTSVVRSDAFVTKVAAPGNSLVYSTFLGGSLYDWGNSLALDSSGAAHIGGQTGSGDFPTKDAYQSRGSSDLNGFLAKLDATGALVFSTYFNSFRYTAIDAVAVDATGVYAAGWAGFGPDPRHAFVTKFNLAGSASHFYQALYSDDVTVPAIAVDGNGSAYIAGRTRYRLATTANVVQPDLRGGYDGFVAKLNPAGSGWSYVTHLGGTDDDRATSIAVDTAGQAHVVGRTESADFPISSAYDSGIDGSSDAFVSVLNPTGSAFVFSTYLGGSLGDSAAAVAIGGGGAVFVAGDTYSQDFPLVDSAFPSAGAAGDAFLVKMPSNGLNLTYSTLYGRAQVSALAVDANGAAYLAGITDSTLLPTAGCGFDQSHNGSSDVFVAKFIEGSGSVLVTVASSPVGRKVKVDGCLVTAPVTLAWVAGTTHTLDANSPQFDNGTMLSFSSWSDAGAASHTVVAPAANSTYTVNFAGGTCTYGLTPHIHSLDATGGTFAVAVLTQNACPWTTSAPPNWLIGGAASGSGPGNISYFAPVNLGPSRSATITIGSVPLMVNQGGSTAGLGIPPITSPLSGETIRSRGVNLAWGAVAGATGYEVRALANAQQVYFSQHVGAGANSARLDLPNGSYQIYVRACANKFTDATCGFLTSVGVIVSLLAPSASPLILTPSAGQTLASSTFQFTWEAVAGATSYEVGIFDNQRLRQELLIATPLTNTIYTMPSSTDYRLTVRACQVACGPSSPPRSFRTQLPPIPAVAPTGLAANVTGGNLANIIWNAVAGAEFYRVQVVQPNTGPGGGALTVAARQLSATSISLPVPTGPANVIVAACNGDRCSQYSGAVAITPTGPSPQAPIISAPMAGVKVDGPGVIFSWTRIPGDNGSNTSYRLYVGDLSTGDPVLDVITNNNFYGALLRAESRRYDALVIATQGSTTVRGPAQGFLVGGNSAVAPTVSAPAHGSTVPQGLTTLKWSPVVGAARYQYAVVPQTADAAVPVVSGITPGLFTDVQLSAGVHTVLMRACPNANSAQCPLNSDAGWGPWSNVAGGFAQFTVAP